MDRTVDKLKRDMHRTMAGLEASGIGVWSLDVMTGRVEADGQARAIWGLAPDTIITVEAIENAMVAEDRALRRSAHAQGTKHDGDSRIEVEYRIASRAGQPERWVAERGQLEIEAGRLRRIAGTIRDITARKSADEALSTSKATLAGLIENADDAIISIDAGQRITLFNPGAERAFGYLQQDMIGQPLDRIIPQRLRGLHHHHIARFGKATETHRGMGERGQIFGLRKDGTEFPAEASISRLDLPTGPVFTAFLRDITERVAGERALADNEERLNLALAAGRVGLFEHDHATGKVYWSPTYREMLGATADEIASVENYLMRVPEDERSAVVAAIEQAHRPGGGSFAIEHRIVRPDGTLRWLSFKARVHFEDHDRGGGKTRTIGAVQDITDHKRLALDLEQLVTERTRELREEIRQRERAQEALSRAQRMEAFGQLAGGVAHDFNNLLTVISGNLELLEMRLEGDKELTLLKRAKDATEMGARLTSRLLTFARRRRLEPTLIDPNEQISSMIELLRRAIGEQVTLRTNFTPHLGAVRADPSEIENAVLNLAINARDAMPNGGSITIETDAYTVDDDGSSDPRLPPGDYVRLSVADTGTGMEPHVLAHAFEPFFTTKAPGQGTGLGLSTIYGFAQQHGGTAAIYSEKGRGTTVNIYLPRVQAAGGTKRLERARAEPECGSGETILVVEDNPEVRRLARTRLEGLGYHVLEAENGPAAIERLQAPGHGIAVVFSDVVMPGGLSGFDLVAWAATHVPEVKLLLASGYPEAVARGQVDAATDVKLLRKPYSRADLARAISGLLSS